MLTKDTEILATVTRIIELTFDEQIAQGEIELLQARLYVIDHHITQQLGGYKWPNE